MEIHYGLNFGSKNENLKPDGYECSFCGNIQSDPGMGMGCDSCGLFNVMEEFYW